MPYNYKKTAYELVKEAAHSFGKDGKPFHYFEVISYIRTHYPDYPFKDNTIQLHLRELSKNIESSKRNHPRYTKSLFSSISVMECSSWLKNRKLNNPRQTEIELIQRPLRKE